MSDTQIIIAAVLYLAGAVSFAYFFNALCYPNFSWAGYIRPDSRNMAVAFALWWFITGVLLICLVVTAPYLIMKRAAQAGIKSATTVSRLRTRYMDLPDLRVDEHKDG